jgi:hypothetical protein
MRHFKVVLFQEWILDWIHDIRSTDAVSYVAHDRVGALAEFETDGFNG